MSHHKSTSVAKSKHRRRLRQVTVLALHKRRRKSKVLDSWKQIVELSCAAGVHRECLHTCRCLFCISCLMPMATVTIINCLE